MGIAAILKYLSQQGRQFEEQIDAEVRYDGSTIPRSSKCTRIIIRALHLRLLTTVNKILEPNI